MAAPCFTNMGPIGESEVDFDAPAESAWLIVPPVFAPAFILGLTGYRRTLTFTMATVRARRSDAESFLEKFIAKLPLGLAATEPVER